MSLGNYVGPCQNLATELIDSVSPEDLAALHAALKGRKVIDWLRWRVDNEGLVSEFVAATPRERQSRKKFKADRLYLSMAGVQHCLEAHALLRAVVDNMLVPGNSYRGMAANAGVAFSDVVTAPVPYWPFPGLETPFADDPGVDDASNEEP